MRELHSVPQPTMADWKFIDELKTPLHQPMSWRRTAPRPGEIELSRGVALSLAFPDPKAVLATAFADFRAFLAAGRIPEDGAYPIAVEEAPMPCFEAYRIEAKADGCRVLAADTEGVRRALVHLEDEIRRTGGPFLAPGNRERRPVIRTRISRCFFGPIKRPPMNRDELADDVDYYPDEYLNRLAHEGINGLWLTVKFSELCPSEFFPEFGKGRERRLAKLRATVAKCARYGIRIFPFAIEPQGFGAVDEYLLPASYLEGNEALAGHRAWAVNFCTSTAEGQRFLEQSTYFLFSQVPGLGGLISINLGERPTHCYSATHQFFDNRCPRCSKRKPWEVLADTTAAFALGMHRADPRAEMISWLYIPYMDEMEKTKPVIAEIAAHIPKEVTLQSNFESAGEVEQLGKTRIALDYWLAWPGPSGLFSQCAKNALAAGARMSAKIQVGCSHEVATIPFIPVPGNLYKKYRAMHGLGVSTVMQCWYFGNYPGLMNKAAGELSFAPFEEKEDDFLLRLAAIDWPGDEAAVAGAWKDFQEGYSQFPVNLPFTWYGPVHNSVVWPLHLIPVDRPISPSWKFTFPIDAGDRIGECLSFGHTLGEGLLLLEKMDTLWRRGVETLSALRPKYVGDAPRLLDIGLAEAIGIQIHSAHQVYRFYDLRERLPFQDPPTQRESLGTLRAIVREEMASSRRLAELCLADSRLGFHSEAEAYKYFPAKFHWRIELLAKLLETEFPAVEASIAERQPLFPEYTGAAPTGKTYACPRFPAEAPWEPFHGGRGRWRAVLDGSDLLVTVEAALPEGQGSFFVEIEPRRLWPVMKFELLADGKRKHHNKLPIPDNRWSAAQTGVAVRTAQFRIPNPVIREEDFSRPLRINVYTAGPEGTSDAWIEKHPWEPRLFFGDDNPSDLGWMFFP
ncbi:MAG: hypothetical protein J0L75_06565 [Spirochaetes bacterium]|nr:hypothetical protein [Spirochaetota bacterium]